MSYKFNVAMKKELFENANFKQCKFAEEIGITKYHLSQIVNGHCNCSKPIAILFTMFINKQKGTEYDMHDLFQQN